MKALLKSYRALLAGLVTLAMSCQMGAEPVCRALVIGLGEQQDKAWAKINGDNDARMVAKMLREVGYTDITTLVNAQATKEAIVDAFRLLAVRCSQGDKVFIHYSGHGQWVTDIDGDEAQRWTGLHAQYDESWVPYDAYMAYGPNDHGEHHLVDDEVALLLHGVRSRIGSTGELVVVIDACHSGDSTGAPAVADEMQEPEIVRGVDVKFTIPRPAAAPKPVKPRPDAWLTITACRPYELCTEIASLKVGKLTYAICTLGLGVTRSSNREIENEITRFVKRYQGRIPQSPMVTGRK